ncbi:RNase HII [Actinobaculum suis]|uniref:Ribonuclease n=1 Tax=Actinobaculum suis TaxID=1657 RepID=A0A1G6ZI19_9ACTO|nr:ribonuclease HII [Actinobaculum suis]MDY5154025.1 ribonuclease HII [Actinobaculum suis]SDE02374.1 RNase HII [Actinobaculum suis]
MAVSNGPTGRRGANSQRGHATRRSSNNGRGATTPRKSASRQGTQKHRKSANRHDPTRTLEKEMLAELAATGTHTAATVNSARAQGQANTNPAGSKARGPILAGVDEVGRGAIAGPVCVGIALVDETVPDTFPPGLRDSKMLSEKAREGLYSAVRAWPLAVEVGYASAATVDSFGIIGALRAAAADALAKLAARGYTLDAVLLDGTHNWWTTEPDALLEIGPVLPAIPVRTVRKADADCAVVAAASIVAKVERDHVMVALAEQYPGYDWASNKGYGSAGHGAALSSLGVSPQHRVSWHLPGVRRNQHERN